MRPQLNNAIVSILFIALGGPAILLVYLPFWLTRFRIPADEPLWQMVAAFAMIVAGLVPLFESADRFVRFGRGTLVPLMATQHLVVSGLYRRLRNPMYAGVLVSLAGETILLRSIAMAVGLATALAGFHLFVCLYEEPVLTRRYGEEYLHYKRNVPRWLPRSTPWTSESRR